VDRRREAQPWAWQAELMTFRERGIAITYYSWDLSIAGCAQYTEALMFTWHEPLRKGEIKIYSIKILLISGRT